MAQDRKVFVGGVPQELNQDDLYAIFTEYAGVKKAWLQKCRAGDDGSNTCPPQNHRGFGFVIFHDASTIDELLGSGQSRFIVLQSGAKLEVKRALSSNKMGQENAQANGEGGGRHRGQHGQAFRGCTASDLSSSHIVGSTSQNRNSAQQSQNGSSRTNNRTSPATATQPQASQSNVAATAPWPSSNADPAALRQLALISPNVASAANYLGGALNGNVLAAASGAAGTMQRQAGPAATDPAVAAAIPQLDVPAGGFRAVSPHVQGAMANLQPPGLAAKATSQNAATPMASLRESIVNFYERNCPQKLTERDLIDFICSIYDGREGELDAVLRMKYGTGLHEQPGSQMKVNGGTVGAAVQGSVSRPLNACGMALGAGPRNANTPTMPAIDAEAEARAAAYSLTEPAYAPTLNSEAWNMALSAAAVAAATAPNSKKLSAGPIAAGGVDATTAAAFLHQTSPSVAVATAMAMQQQHQAVAAAASARCNAGIAAVAVGGRGGVSLAAPGLSPSWTDGEGRTLGTNGPDTQGFHQDGLFGLRDYNDVYVPGVGGDPEGPDFSWVDQIVADDSLEISEEVARVIVGKSAGMPRKDYLPTNIVW